MESLTLAHVLLVGIAWLIVLFVYRLYFSPMSNFPGPKLAALTSWYEKYFDVVKGGQYTLHIQELHKRYGPVIRINPTEVHIDDPEYYDSIYSNSLHLDKLSTFNYRWNSPGATQSTGPHELHRLRRTALNPFFSRKQVLLLWPYIVEKSDKLCQKIEEKYVDSDKPLNATKAFGCFSLDVITEYIFGKPYNDLDNDDFHSGLTAVMAQLMQGVHVATHFPWLLKLMNSLPLAWQQRLNPGLAVVTMYQDMIREQISEIMQQNHEEKEVVGHKTVFHELLESNLPASELTVKRLSDEANILVGAGSDTVKHFLELVLFHVLDNSQVHQRLQAELIEAMPNRSCILSLPEMERLPYLAAIIQEGLRLSYGVTQRSPRISRTEPFDYHGQVIPPGYAVSMDPVHMHHNENIFPDSHAFLPERWLQDKSKGLQRYNIAFSRGTRQCAGMNLANAELFLMVSTMFRRYDMQLYNTNVDSVKLFADNFLPFPKKGTQGVRVLMKSRAS